MLLMRFLDGVADIVGRHDRRPLHDRNYIADDNTEVARLAGLLKRR